MSLTLILHPAVTASWLIVVALAVVGTFSYIAAVFTMDSGPDWFAGIALAIRALLFVALVAAILLTIGQLIFWEAP